MLLKTALAIPKATLMLQAIKMQPLLKVKAIETLSVTILGSIPTQLPVVGQKRRPRRCLPYFLEVAPIYANMNDDDDDVDDDDNDDENDDDIVVKGGEGRTTESIRSGLKDARVVKGLGDKVKR